MLFSKRWQQLPISGVIVILLMTLSVDKTFAGGWECAASAIVGLPVGCISADANATVSLDATVKVDDSVIRALNVTGRNINSVIDNVGGETRATLLQAQQELSSLLGEVNQYAGLRIADLDDRVTAKLGWVEQYTEDLNHYVLGIIQTVSTESQRLAETIGDQARFTIGVFGNEVRGIVTTAGGVVMDVTDKISAEVKARIQQATTGVMQLLQEVRRIIADFDHSVVTVFNKVTYVIDLTTDRVITVAGVVLGVIFLFIAFKSWGTGLLSHRLPKPGPTRRFIQTFMAGTFVASLLPFLLVIAPFRAIVMVSVNGAKAYHEQEVAPRFWNVSPLPLVISNDEVPEFGCTIPAFVHCATVEGANFLANAGVVTAAFADLPLNVIASDNSVTVDFSPITNYGASDHVTIKFGQAENSPSFQIPILRHSSIAAQPTTQVIVPTVNTVRVIHDGFVRIRSGPGNYPELYRAQHDETFEILARYPYTSPEWYLITFVDSEGNRRTGWMTGDPTLVAVTQVTDIPTNTQQQFQDFPAPQLTTNTPTSAANLVISDVKFSFNFSSMPDAICGKPLDTFVTVTNQGTVASPMSKIHIEDRYVGDGSLQEEAYETIPALEPGQTTPRIQLQMTISTYYNELHSLQITVDPENVVSESNKTDNQQSFPNPLGKGNCP
ncbi:MAG: CARDB domain-containing protein [Anaerolineae bacterium]